MIVVIKSGTVKAADVNVFPPIVVEVANRNAVSPPTEIQSRLGRHIDKLSIVPIAVKPRWMAFAGTEVFDG